MKHGIDRAFVRRHAGDIGSLEVAEKLAAFRPLRAVYGNIDGQEIRKLFPQVNRFTVDDTEVWHSIPDDEVAYHAGDGAEGVFIMFVSRIEIGSHVCLLSL